MTEPTPSTIPAPISAADGEGPDKWAGLSDSAERRRRQNRVNQRAYRMRKRAQLSKDIHPKTLVRSPTTSVVQSQESPAKSSTPKPCHSPSMIQYFLDHFAKSAIESYARGDPTADHLMTLTKVNVFRAFATNIRLLGWSEMWWADDAISKFNTDQPHALQSTDAASSIPHNLLPTRIQKSKPHHPWLDFFPLPKMRDNMIEAGDDWDDEQLCHDIMGFWGASTMDAGLLVWGEPWDVRNWELTEPFLKKWQWVVRGCPELMDATNSWRARRGEKLIFRYI